MLNAMTATLNEREYRIIYLMESEFEQRMKDVYIATQNDKGAPFLDDMIQELLDIEALLFLEYMKRRPSNYEIRKEDIENLRMDILGGDFEAVVYVFERCDRYFSEMFERDVVNFLMEKQLSFFERIHPFGSRSDSYLYNQPVVSVW